MLDIPNRTLINNLRSTRVHVYTLRVQNISNQEVADITIYGKTEDERIDSFNNELDKYNMYFGDDVALYDYTTQERVATLISCPEALASYIFQGY